MNFLQMQALDLHGKRVLIRQDLNVPIKDGIITNDARIQASLPTIEMALQKGAAVTLMSHLGRPTEGQVDDSFSLAPIAEHLSKLLGQTVTLQTGFISAEAGEVILWENVRFHQGEKANSDELAQTMAAACDIFVMDAFGTAHRAHASTHGVAKYAPLACAGPLLSSELLALGKVLENPARPVVAIVGGAKVSTKLSVLNALSERVDQLIVGGGIANTFIAAQGHDVGKSLYEADFIESAQQLMKQVQLTIPMPVDVVCGNEFSAHSQAVTKPVSQVTDEDMIFDIGTATATHYASIIKAAGTLIWNGPVGVFEFDQFSAGTRAVAEAVASSQAFSVAGGGDTIAAIEQFDVADEVSYISTGGGAFLEFLEGKLLPAVDILQQRAV